jgi:hypothetical protein
MRWAGHVAHMKKNEYRILVGMPRGKRPLGKPGRQFEYSTVTI